MQSAGPSQSFSEMVRGTRWKERQRQYHRDQGEPIFGPDSFLCWVIAALFLLLFFIVGPDGRDAYYESWRWLMHGLFLLVVAALLAQCYSNAKNPNMAYWVIFLGHTTIFMSGIVVGGIIFTRFV